MTPERELHWRAIAYYARRCGDWASYRSAILVVYNALPRNSHLPRPPTDDDEGSA